VVVDLNRAIIDKQRERPSLLQQVVYRLSFITFPRHDTQRRAQLELEVDHHLARLPQIRAIG